MKGFVFDDINMCDNFSEQHIQLKFQVNLKTIATKNYKL